jgi:hypothetical protein
LIGPTLPKKEILMAYVSNLGTLFGIKLPKKAIFDGTHMPKKEILMDYVSNLKTHF